MYNNTFAKTYSISLTEAQWSLKEDGVRMRTGHASRMQEVTAMACVCNQITGLIIRKKDYRSFPM